MSFAATLALVTVYAGLRDRDWSESRWPRAVRYVGGVALTSFVAGAATAPIAAVHFNQVPHFGLIANIAAVPIMGALVIPGAVFAALLSPFGLEDAGFALMAVAITWILAVADTVLSWPGALSHVTAPGRVVLPLLGLAGVTVAFWQGRGRWLGVAPLVAALGIWSVTDRPDVLVNDTGGLLGIAGPDGRAISKARGNGFAAMSWLENDGDPASQEHAFERWQSEADGRLEKINVKGLTILQARGEKAGARALEMCRAFDIVVLTMKAEPVSGCEIYDAGRLRQTGALAIDIGPKGPTVTTARAHQGARLWSQ